jgi:phage terminase large subunit GpA-like protein
MTYGRSAIADWLVPCDIRPPGTVSAWADRCRILPEASASRGARWRTSTAAYLGGIMDAVHEPGIRKVAVMKAAQTGATESLLNILGYAIASAPSPILVVAPTFADAERMSKGRLADMIRTTPALSATVTDRRLTGKDARGASTILLKQFAGGFLALGGSNTPNTFASISVRLAIGDDVDRWPMLDDEGDPVALLMNRIRTFRDGRALFTSTPTLAGGRIDSLFQRSDRRRYHVACPSCGHVDFIAWADAAHFRVSWDDRDPTTARLECPACAAHLTDADRRAMVQAGTWRATATADEPGLVGFHVPGMLSPWLTLTEIVAEFLAARAGGREAFRVFVNTLLGEGWEDRDSPRIEPHALLSRRETYEAEVPSAAAVLTAGCDVQADRIETQVIAWGAHLERWVIDWTVVPGDPRRRETWELLRDVLAGTYQHASGRHLAITATCIDSGFLAGEVYDFVLAHQHRRIFATKGESHGTAEPLVMRVSERKTGKQARPVRLHRLNVDAGKAELAAVLALPPGGPGTMHFHAGLGEPYFVQLTSEHKERFYVQGVARERWTKQDGARNEAWDTAILARAAFDIVSNGRHDALVTRAAAALNGGRDAA